MNGSLRDKVFGCWLGKNIGGTIGAPVEGWKSEPMLPLAFPEQNEPNDDLDLQLLWLAMVRKKGLRFKHDDLAEAWSGTTFRFDEYGIAIANIERGMRPPLTGRFNNYFSECMGCPIRSEIWAVIAANMPETAAYYAMLDATVDHDGESVYAEIFYAALESMAFSATVDDLHRLIYEALEFIPADCRISIAVNEVMDAYKAGVSASDLRKELIRKYDFGNFSHCLINIAFTIAALVYAEGDFLKSMIGAANFAYDADCTAATAGAVMGILMGADAIREKYQVAFDERVLTCGVTADMIPFMPTSINELTDWTMALHEDLLKMDDKPVLEKPFRVKMHAEGQLCLQRSFAVGCFASYDEAMASGDWTIHTTAGDLLTIPVEAGKKVYIRATVKAPGVTEKLRLSPDVSAPAKVWIDGKEMGGFEQRSFITPSPHRSWGVSEFVTVPEEGCVVVTEVTPDVTGDLEYWLIVARADKSHEIHAEITA